MDTMRHIKILTILGILSIIGVASSVITLLIMCN